MYTFEINAKHVRRLSVQYETWPVEEMYMQWLVINVHVDSFKF